MITYYIKRIFFILAYMTSMYVSFYTFLMPAVWFHGVWHLVYIFIATFLVSFLSTFAFLSTRKPQATLKRSTI